MNLAGISATVTKVSDIITESMRIYAEICDATDVQISVSSMLQKAEILNKIEGIGRDIENIRAIVKRDLTMVRRKIRAHKRLMAFPMKYARTVKRIRTQKSPHNVLKRDGVIVVPCIRDPESRVKFHSDVMNYFKHAPEFKPVANDKLSSSIFSLDEMGTCNFPSSFHNLPVRYLRQLMTSTVLPILRYLKKDGTERLEVLIKRLVYCVKGQCAPTYNLCRSGNIDDDGDIILSSWINLTTLPMTTSVYNGSHKTCNGRKTFDRHETDIYRSNHGSMTTVIIPPGHVMLFYDSILRERGPSMQESNEPLVCLHQGYRITHTTTPIQQNIGQVLEYQGSITLNTGKKTQLYPDRLWDSPAGRIIISNFSQQRIKRQFRCLKKIKTDKHVEEFDVVNKHIAPLRYTAMPMYIPYTMDERLLYYPTHRKRFNLSKEQNGREKNVNMIF